MTLTKEAITRSVFDCLDLFKAVTAVVVEAAFEFVKKPLRPVRMSLLAALGISA
jgi:hypothetical protein